MLSRPFRHQYNVRLAIDPKINRWLIYRRAIAGHVDLLICVDIEKRHVVFYAAGILEWNKLQRLAAHLLLLEGIIAAHIPRKSVPDVYCYENIDPISLGLLARKLDPVAST